MPGGDKTVLMDKGETEYRTEEDMVQEAPPIQPSPPMGHNLFEVPMNVLVPTPSADSMDAETTTSSPLVPTDSTDSIDEETTPSTGSMDEESSGHVKKASKRAREDSAEEDKQTKKKRDPRTWAQGKLQVSWDWRNKVVHLSQRPQKQFSGSKGEGAHTVAWTVVDRAVQSNLSGSANAAEAVERLWSMVMHLAESPLTRIAPPEGRTLRTMQHTDVTVESVAYGNLMSSLDLAEDEPDKYLNQSIKDLLVWRNTLPFAAVQRDAPGAGEGTYAPRLANREGLLRSAWKGRKLPGSTVEEIQFSTFKLVDTVALLDELSEQVEDPDSDEKRQKYDDGTAEATFAAVVTTLLDEVSRWAPLSLRAAGLHVPDAEAPQRAGTVTEALEDYLAAELREATEEDARLETQHKREGGMFQRPYVRVKSRKWQARVDWFESHKDAVQEQLETTMKWIGDYKFDPAYVTRSPERLAVAADFTNGKLKLEIDGRPKSPFSGSEGSHITAWELEKRATITRLAGKNGAGVEQELKAMLAECDTTPAVALLKYLPAEERDLTTGLMATAKKELTSAVEKVEKAEEAAKLGKDSDIRPLIVEAVRAYQDYRNVLPFATTFAGSRDGHGEGAALQNADKASQEALESLKPKLYDKKSLLDEIGFLEVEKHSEKIIAARKQEHDIQFKRAFPKFK
ncbi:hypothetical protein [Streptomyces sp. NPDC001980]|uniref:hypothetical protein n=1 Tax=Streptomyces sp. NPDC001980 TaxID=3157126 RepID=UPI00331DFAF7